MEENAKICNVKKENMEQYGIIIHAHITPDEPRSYPLSGKSYNDFGFLHLVPLSPEESFWRRFGAAPLASIFHWGCRTSVFPPGPGNSPGQGETQ